MILKTFRREHPSLRDAARLRHEHAVLARFDDDSVVRTHGAFTQGAESTTRGFEGTGVSLAVAHRFCALLGGELSAASTPGHGATFTVLLPVGREPATRTSLPA